MQHPDISGTNRIYTAAADALASYISTIASII